MTEKLDLRISVGLPKDKQIFLDIYLDFEITIKNTMEEF
jgi:hypothetical protein